MNEFPTYNILTQILHTPMVTLSPIHLSNTTDNPYIQAHSQTHSHGHTLSPTLLPDSSQTIHTGTLPNTLPWSHSLTYISPRQQTNPYIQTHSHKHTPMVTLPPTHSQSHVQAYSAKHYNNITHYYSLSLIAANCVGIG